MHLFYLLVKYSVFLVKPNIFSALNSLSVDRNVEIQRCLLTLYRLAGRELTEVDVPMNLYMYVFDIMPKEQFYYILLRLHYLNFKPSHLEFGDIFHKLHPRVLQAAV